MPLAPSASAKPCRLVYLDIGSNTGDSIEAFVHRRAELRLAETLNVAVAKWSPHSTCVYGFEPNPAHTVRLRQVRDRLAPHVSNLTIYTETAVGGPEQLAHPLWLIPQGVRGIGSMLSSSPPKSGIRARPLTTIRLASWLRDVVARRHGLRTPVVMRLDVEGTEYDILPDLATSGIGRDMNLYVTLEWHRHVKDSFLGPPELAHMAMLDNRFARYFWRCGDGSCSVVDDRGYMSPHVRGANTSLRLNLEKTLTYMLHRAGITYVDGYNHKHGNPADWNATRQRNHATEYAAKRDEIVTSPEA